MFLVQHFSEMGERKKKKRQRGQRGLVRKEVKIIFFVMGV